MALLYTFTLALGGLVAGFAVGYGAANAGAPHWSLGIKEGVLSGLLGLAAGAGAGAVVGLAVGPVLHATERAVPPGEGRPRLAPSIWINTAGWGLGLGLIGLIVGWSERGVDRGLVGLMLALPIGVSIGLALGPALHIYALLQQSRKR